MQRTVFLIPLILIVMLLFTFPARAAELDVFDDDIRELEDAVGGDTARDLDELGVSGVEDVLTDGVDTAALFGYLIGQASKYSAGPLSALTVLTAVILLAAVGESYTASLRYTGTREIMGAVVALFIVSSVVVPVTELVSSASAVISGASAVMTVYLPVMAGIMAFSGHAVSSAGYYTAVTAASGVLSRVSSSLLMPVMQLLLSLSVSAGIGGRLRLSGLIEMLSKGLKYLLTFLMSMYAAVLGLNSALSAAGDGLAGRAAKFSLSSFVPLIGSSIAEAYGAIQGSVGVLRSGIGVFVILAVFVSFAPVLIRTLLWSAAIWAADAVGEVFGVTSATAVLRSLSSFLTALRALLVSAAVAFLVSSAVMLRAGGAA